MKNIVCVLFLVNLIFVNSIFALATFTRGRHSRGNLGDPSKNSQIDVTGIKEQWFTQILDHFDSRNPNTWQQRYFVNKSFWNGTGPAFLMLAGEGEASPKWMREGAWIHYARQHGALCFYLEHRFFGKSHPKATTEDMFIPVDNSLADVTRFITAMNKEYELKDKKWIAFGGFYGGALATWLRERYSHLVHSAVTSSAPVLAQVDFADYYKITELSISSYSDKCVEAVKDTFTTIDGLLKKKEGQKTLQNALNLCDGNFSSEDTTNLYELLASLVSRVVLHHQVNTPESIMSIDDFCTTMTNKAVGSRISRFAMINKMFLDHDKQSCLDYKYQKMIDDLKKTSWDSEGAKGSRQRIRQNCDDLGMFPTSGTSDAFFRDRIPLSFFIKICGDVFGAKYDADALQRGANRTNMQFGGLNPGTTNVLSIHSIMDPWFPLGLTKYSTTQVSAVFMNGTSHCADMYEPHENDVADLKEARKTIQKFLVDTLNGESCNFVV